MGCGHSTRVSKVVDYYFFPVFFLLILTFVQFDTFFMLERIDSIAITQSIITIGSIYILHAMGVIKLFYLVLYRFTDFIMQLDFATDTLCA